MPREMAADLHSSSNIESSTIKTNQTPIKYQDKNFLLPLKSSDKKLGKKLEHHIALNNFNLEQQEEGKGGKGVAVDSRNGVMFQAADSSINTTSNGAKEMGTIYAKQQNEGEDGQQQSKAAYGQEAAPKQPKASPRSEPAGHARHP